MLGRRSPPGTPRRRRRWLWLAVAVVLGAFLVAGVLRGPAAPNLCPRFTRPAGAGAVAASAPRIASTVPLGAAVRYDRVTDSPGYARFFLTHYRWLTPENELKMAALEPAAGQFDFRTADALVDWAARHGTRVHGHVLVWGNDLPDWAQRLRERTPTAAGRARAAGALGAYIAAVLRHFRGRIGEWDVVNEAFTDTGRPVDNVWFHELGPAYIADTFAAARRAGPGVRLCYNDLGTELPGAHERAVLAMTRSLRRAGLIDCVGFELHTTVPGPSRSGFAGVLRQFAATGVTSLVSELDVTLAPPAGAAAAVPADAQKALAAQAATYAAVAAACRDDRHCGRITTWGFTDASSWLGTAARALPYDTGCAAKPAARALGAELSRPRA